MSCVSVPAVVAVVTLLVTVLAPVAAARPTHEPPGHREGDRHPGARSGNPHEEPAAEDPVAADDTATADDTAAADDTSTAEVTPELGSLDLDVSVVATEEPEAADPSGDVFSLVLASAPAGSLGELDVVLRTGGSGVSDYVFPQQDANDDDDDDDDDEEESEIPGVPAAGEGERDRPGDDDPTLPFSGVDVRALVSFGALLVAGGYLMIRWRRFILG